MNRTETLRLVLPLLGEATRFAHWLAPANREADDVVQEAVVRVLAAKRGPADPRRVKSWLLRIVRNVWIDARRSQVARDRLVVLEGGLDELADVEVVPRGGAPWDHHDLEAALAELPEVARSALLLSDLWGFDQEEIAEVLEVPVGTVKSRVARARGRVAALLSRRAGAERETKERP